MNIYGFNTLTLLDYPGLVACTVFLGGCNFRCPFCHNGGLVLSPKSQPEIPLEEVLSHLKKRQGILDGVCVSGGEPTLSSELPEFFSLLKGLGFRTKLDTNGTNPEMLQTLYENKLLDYVAMDIKSSPRHYQEAAGIPLHSLAPIQESIDFLMHSGIDYEFRTTVVRELHKESDFLQISNWISGCKHYVLQAYQENSSNIQHGFSSYTYEELTHFQMLLQKHIPLVELRGIDAPK